ncbi:MAG: twin-arginine translocation pathway signal protein [Rhodothermales bacterium]|nr:twin-arginine translocation pathway signal protein [Rhodothermales bacterium]
MRALLFIFTAGILAGCSESQPTVVPIARDTDRIWLGPEFYANRLQDWALEDGMIRATEGSAAKPMRTAHLLSHALDGAPFTVSVHLDGAARSGSREDWGGLLLGAGSAEIDHRISVLTHHWPAPGGGVFAGIDGAGRLVVRDNGRFADNTGPRRDYVSSDWPVIAVADSLRGPAPEQIRLEVSATQAGSLLMRALDAASGALLAAGTVSELAADAFEGTVALASHGTPFGDGRGYGFADLVVSGKGATASPDRLRGPVLGILYTQSRGTLKLTAQFGPIGPQDTKRARLEARRAGAWVEASEASIDPVSRTATFRVEDWNAAEPTEVRVAYALRISEGESSDRYYEGFVPAEPRNQDVTIGGLNCHHISGGDGSWTHEHFWYPHAELVELTRQKDPDLLYFAGDQIYEGGLEGIVRSPTDTAVLDYLNHWYRFVYAFGDLTRNRPTVVIPDDHDVYHGNIWGSGGKAATGPFRPASDNGGYIMPPEFVNAVHATQTAHLPDPVDPTPIEQGISVYYTDMVYGGVSFAILADRMWKSAPRSLLPSAEIRNGWSIHADYDGRNSNVAGAELLGSRQEQFLENWADDWSGGAWMKVVLSQTPFANVATIPEEATNGSVIPGLPNPAPGEYLEGYKKAVDHDSGGWPQQARDRAIGSMRRGFAVHLAGDQHLGFVVQYGLDDYRDAGYAFAIPSIANIWPRRWFPPDAGLNRAQDAPRYTGDHLDGFGNRMTVWAVANPVDAGVEPKALYDRTPGLGIITLSAAERTATFEAWPRWTDPNNPDAPQYEGWPITFHQEDGYARPRAGLLSAVSLEGSEHPVVRVDDETTGEWLYTIRATGPSFSPWVFDSTHAYSVRVSDPDLGLELRLTDQRVAEAIRPE